MNQNVIINPSLRNGDIKYRAPLSYRYMRIVGWTALIIAQIGIIFALAAKFWNYEGTTHNIDALSNASDVLAFFGELAVPCLLIANFALILSARENIKRVVITHITFAVTIYLVFIIAYSRYIRGLAIHFLGPDSDELVDSLIILFFSKYLNFDVFIDLVMCSTMFFFINYRPKKYFTGKKIYIFRLFTLIPIFYEFTCLITKGLSLGEGQFIISPFVIPLLTSKPIMTFVAFFIISIHFKRRENRYLRYGLYHEDYNNYLLTNRNSFYTSLFIAITFVICGLIDVVVTFLIVINFIQKYSFLDLQTLLLFVKQLNAYIATWGFGKGVCLVISAPLILLFSYTKSHTIKTKIWDLIIPLLGLLGFIFVYIEGTYDLIIFR